MYFSTLPKTFYEFKLIDSTHELVDIFARMKFKFKNSFSFVTNRPHMEYSISLGDTPDIIADKFYGSSDWWWLVLLYNDIINPFSDIPRLGFDSLKNNSRFGVPINKNLPAGYDVKITNKNSVAYLGRIEGEDQRDFQTGDVILKTTGSSYSAVTQNVVGKQGNQKTLKQISGPEIDLNLDTRAGRKIISWDASKREAVLDTMGTGSFSEGDHVAVIERDSAGLYKPVVMGKIYKYFVDARDSISHFIDSRTGQKVHPHYRPHTGKIQNLYPNGIGQENVGSSWQNGIGLTVLDRFMNTIGTISEQEDYVAVTEEERISQEYDKKTRIKLIDPQYKYDALNILKKLMAGARYASYSSEVNTAKNSKSQTIRGSGGTQRSRIY